MLEGDRYHICGCDSLLSILVNRKPEPLVSRATAIKSELYAVREGLNVSRIDRDSGW